MGLFSHALQHVGLDAVLNRAAAPLNALPVPLLLAVIPLMIVAFSLIGVHPMVSLAVLGPLLMQLVGGATALQLSLATALGCCLSYMVSPFAGWSCCSPICSISRPGRSPCGRTSASPCSIMRWLPWPFVCFRPAHPHAKRGEAEACSLGLNGPAAGGYTERKSGPAGGWAKGEERGQC